MLMLGFTGTRGVGKSHIANLLEVEFGFTRIHTFGPGKAMCVEYAKHCGIDSHTAYRMVYEDLKDVPHSLMPGDGTMRTFMEDFGKFLGVDQGPDYTMGIEIRRALAFNPEAKLLVESVVYEADYFRNLGGKIVSIHRPSVAGFIEGKHTDFAVAAIRSDYSLDNSSNDELVTHNQISLMLDFFGA